MTAKSTSTNFTGSKGGTFTITKANATCPTLTAYSGVYDGASHTITVGTDAV